jgi:hypothetical protein
MAYALDLSKAAREWLDSHSDRQLVSDIATWIRDELCDPGEDRPEIECVGIRSPSGGQAWLVTEVEHLGVVICFFMANPFNTIKVMWIQPSAELEGES